MTEEFLHYVWKYGLFAKETISTTRGEPLQILHPGTANHDAGPDFFNASVRIGSTLWAGNIEIHLKSSDWQKHGHQSDAAYNNVILHVVAEDDKPPALPNGSELPVFIPKIDRRALDNYDELVKSPGWPACSHYIDRIDPIFIAATFNSAVIERMQNKTAQILRLYSETHNDWNETFYRFLARSFGFKTNALPFELLAKATPLKILARHKKNLFDTEALLFGQSGLLNEQLLGDDYFLDLRDRYGFLARKYSLHGIETHLWKFLRMRPANFPTLRIAQFAGLINRSEGLLSRILEAAGPNTIKQLFEVQASVYWDTHFKFNTLSTTSEKHLGETAIDTLLINAIAPFVFIYGEHNDKAPLRTKAMQLLESLPAEENHIIKRWQELGVICQSAFDTQALIQLKNFYCEKKMCLKCQFGYKVINR